MAHIFHNPNKIKLPKSQHEAEEFSAKSGVVLCKNCGAAYFKKHWHHSLEKLNLKESESVAAGKKDVKFALCPACLMIQNKQYEGRIRIKNFPENYNGLEKLVEEFGERAYEIDPMDRVIEIKKLATGEWEIKTTENELANKLAHKIKETFGKLKSRTKFAPEPSDVAEITIEFTGE